ncbi:MAG TPA: PLP-dependent aminotransferase family protein [Devosia sp.]|jgi:GntR family transcriptional regulator/MocR family aminotransferase|nr:PLP-dependent aminotransferase family protein [Devosia sp.]
MKQSFPLDSVSLDRGISMPLHRQLYARLRSMIEERVLAPGHALPSSRSLAQDLSVSRNTVVSVYEQLSTEGYISGRPGVRPVVVDLPERTAPETRAKTNDRRRLLSARGQLMVRQPAHHGAAGHLAFHPGMPDADSFPFNTWSRLLARRAKLARNDLFGTYYVNGYPPLQRAIADYLKVARGVRCRPEQIIVTTGAQAALDILARVLLDAGDAAWVEEPGYYGAQAAFVAAGAQLVPLHIDDQGWRLTPPTNQTPRLIYVTPACQHPLGATMRMDQRLRLIELAERMDAFVIEDDFDGEYRFLGRPVPAMQGADTSDRVIYVGTFAKLLFPALRLGFMVLPEFLLPDISSVLSTTGQFAPLLLQAALADFIDEGHMSMHLKRMRRIYAARRDTFRSYAQRELSEWLSLLPTDAGIQFVGELRPGLSDVAIAAAARRRGLNISPLSMHYRHTKPAPGLVLGYAAINEANMPAAFRSLKQAFVEATAIAVG